MRQSIILLMLGHLLVYFSCATNRDKYEHSSYIEVFKIVDGDTFWAKDGSDKGIKIRLIGVDAPESRNTGKKKIGYYGQQSKDYLTGMLENKKVRLEYDVDRFDQYGRTLAYVYLENGTFVNAELIKQGYAMLMTVPPNVKYAEKFVKLQRRARSKNLGLWKEEQYEK